MPQSTPPVIVPFWQRLPEISRYPLRPAALGWIGLLAVLRLLGLLPGIAGWVLDLIVSLALYRFAVECLIATAHGRLDPPEWNNRADTDDAWGMLALQFGMMMLVLLGFFLFGPELGLVFLFFVIAAGPAATMSVAIEGSVLNALNPLKWIAVMTRFGWPYFVVVLLCLVYAVSHANLLAFVEGALPTVVAVVVANLLVHYVVVVTFHLMGYLIWQYHDEIGFEVETPRARVDLRADPDQDTLDAVHALLSEGRPQEAADRLESVVYGGRGATLAVHDRLDKVLAVLADPARRLRHAREYIRVLLAQNQSRKAVDVLRDAQGMDAGFMPLDGDDVAPLADEAVRRGQHAVALRVLSGFRKQFPKHADLPRNYLLAARLLTEHAAREDQALAILRQLEHAFPQHALAGEIAQYRQFVEKLVATTGPRRGPSTA